MVTDGPPTTVTTDEAEVIVRHELEADEQLVWAGRPYQGLRFHIGDIVPVIAWLVFSGGITFVLVVASLIDAWALCGVPFLLVGLYFAMGRFWIDARRRAKTCYAITSQRLLIVSGSPARVVQSLCLDTLDNIELWDQGDGRGTITVGPGHPFYSDWMRHAWLGLGLYAPAPGLEEVEDVRKVYRLLVRMRLSNSRGSRLAELANTDP